MKNKIGTKQNPMALKTPPLSSEFTMHIDGKMEKKYWYVLLVKQFYIMILELLTTYMLCLKHMAIGWNWAVPMSKNLQKKEQ